MRLTSTETLHDRESSQARADRYLAARWQDLAAGRDPNRHLAEDIVRDILADLLGSGDFEIANPDAAAEAIIRQLRDSGFEIVIDGGDDAR